MNHRPTFAHGNLANLRFNLRSSRAFVGPDVRCMAVIKADAYGHGALECARALEGEGVDWLGVALVEEAVELRSAGIKAPILSLGGFWPGQENALLDNDITPVVFDVDRAKGLADAAQRHANVQPIHVKIDTGMGRLGLRMSECTRFSEELRSLTSLRLEGLMTHFAAADDPGQDDFTLEQIEQFYEAIEIFRSAGFPPSLIDLANSPGAVAHPNSRGNMVRLGGILYGLGGDILPPAVPKPELRPVMSIKSKIAYLKRVPQGETIGYGRTFTTRRDSLIAAIPIGYHDGYPRQLSNKARVIVDQQFAPVVGRISMDWTTIDVTDIHGVTVGDDVVLIGRDGGLCITAEELAGQLGTISYDITCGISARVPRRYHDEETN